MAVAVVVAATVEVDTAEAAVADVVVVVSQIPLPPFVPSLMGLTKAVVGRWLFF